MRMSKTINGVTTTHLWNGASIVLEFNANRAAINRFYRSRSGRLLRSHQHGWYLHNVRGDVVQRTNAAGNILHNYRYSAFGTERDNSAQNTNPFRFAGEYWDWEREEYYLRARSFNPRIGRFTQPDPWWGIHNMQDSPIAILQAANLYVFAINNPVRWIDPTGLFIRDFFERARDTIRGRIHDAATTPLPPITMQQNGNDVTITAFVRIGGSGADLPVSGRDGVTYRQAVLDGIHSNWGGYRGGLNVSVRIADVGSSTVIHSPGQRFMNIEINDSTGVNRFQLPDRGWSLENPGTMQLHTSQYTIGGNLMIFDEHQFMRVVGHEFGHALGVADGFNFGYGGNTSRGDIISIMTNPMESGATRLDLELALRAQRTGQRQWWGSNTGLINTHGIRR